MSRQVIGEYVLTGTLVTRSALAIGNGQSGAATDAACRRDGAGRLVIPGTALAGSLRATFGGLATWGGAQAASALYVEDAPAIGDVVTEVRDGVGIDRRSGSAASGALFSRDVVPRDTNFALDLRVEATGPIDDQVPGLSKEQAFEWVSGIASELSAGRNLGAATSAGLGSIQLVDPQLVWRSIGTRAGLLRLLEAPGGETVTNSLPDAARGTAGPAPAARDEHLRITIPWHPRGPLLVSVPANGLVDRMPLTTGSGRKVRLVIPGSSLKGVLRTRAERILRTLRGAETIDEEFLGQMAQAELDLVHRLFGRPPRKKEAGWRGSLHVAEVHSPEIPLWTDVLKALSARVPKEGSQAAQARPRIEANRVLRHDNGPLRINDHVAVSRWTGGADEGRLFAVAAPGAWFDNWEPIVLDIDLRRLGENPVERRSAVMLVAFLVRDLAEGWIGVGYGTTRGYGEITADPAQVTFAFAANQPEGMDEFAGQAPTLEQILEPKANRLGSQLLGAWKQELGLEPTESGVA